jgi:hypothetical protein
LELAFHDDEFVPAVKVLPKVFQASEPFTTFLEGSLALAYETDKLYALLMSCFLLFHYRRTALREWLTPSLEDAFKNRLSGNVMLAYAAAVDWQHYIGVLALARELEDISRFCYGAVRGLEQSGDKGQFCRELISVLTRDERIVFFSLLAKYSPNILTGELRNALANRRSELYAAIVKSALENRQIRDPRERYVITNRVIEATGDSKARAELKEMRGNVYFSEQFAGNLQFAIDSADVARIEQEKKNIRKAARVRPAFYRLIREKVDEVVFTAPGPSYLEDLLTRGTPTLG